MSVDGLKVQHLGLQPYEKIWQAMSDFTNSRDEHTPDELWLVQHAPVFTQGQAGKPEHILQTGDIPVVQTDRGGQVTYHGPGQLVLYPLINLRRRGLGVRDMVTLLEQVAIQLLSDYGIKAYAKPDAPGVYVQETLKGSGELNGKDIAESKIASLGLRVRRGCCFHGMSINIDMDLSPFALINPCGYAGMKVTQLKDLLGHAEMDYQAIEQSIIALFAKNLGLTENDTV
ncbi:MAG: lipoyl(octanoyl) transferase LipB [Cellvibrionaceae bacterium]